MILLDGKYAAPAFDPGKQLFRDLENLGFPPSEAPFPRFVFLEGQAGQGKTTLAAQLLHQRSAPFCWYRMEESDRTGAYFLGSLLAGLKGTTPAFSTPADASIQSGTLDREQHPRLLTALLTDFCRTLRADFFIVLDDVHLCFPSDETTPLLEVLISHASPHLHLIFLGRRNLAPLIAAARRRGSVISHDNRALAFSSGEIASLCNTLWQVPLTRPAVRTLQQISDGWVMGLLLTIRSLRGNDPNRIETELASLRQRPAVDFDFLLGQVLADLPPEQREALLILSLLEDIPLDLARTMTGCEAIGTVLEEMVRNNCFLRGLGGDKRVFLLHQLFQGGLRQLARQEFSTTELHRLYGLAADWYLAAGQPDWAIRYFLAAEDYLRAEATLSQAGLQFNLQHRLAALRHEIGALPEEIVTFHPWFAYSCGVGLMTEDPPRALPRLQLAHDQFVRRGDALGELLAGAQLMLFSIATDGNYARGYPLLARTMTLLNDFAERLPPRVLGHVANVAVLANTFLHFDPPQAERFFALGLDIALRENLISLEVEARVARLYYLIFSGAWQRCRQELEAALPLLHDPLCSQLYRGAIFLAYMGFLKGCGDFSAYERQKHLYRTQFAASLRERSIFEDYVLLWDLHMHLALGDRERAAATLKAALASKGAAAGPHLKNLFLQYAALLAAEAGERDAALAAMETARELRQQAGGDYFLDLNHAFYGATFDALGEDAQALACFARALDSSSTHLRETALAFRARYSLRRHLTGAQDDLRELLGSMRTEGHGHFYGWMPELMGELLAAAVRTGIETTFARQLAEQRLRCTVLEDGRILPLLEVTTLGSLRFRIGDRDILAESDLGESQRQLLAVLLSRSDLSSPQKRLQLLLWPESNETKSRNNFDKLLSRLRKSLQSACGADAGHYLQLRNGILSLCHCRVDANLFSKLVRQGMKDFREGNHWQAESLLHQARELYRGEFLPSAPESDQVERYRSELLADYQSGVLVHAETLLKVRQPQRAISVLEESLAGDPLHDETAKKLYSLLILHGSPSRAQAVVEGYGAALRREGFHPEEIRETLEAFWD